MTVLHPCSHKAEVYEYQTLIKFKENLLYVTVVQQADAELAVITSQ